MKTATKKTPAKAVKPTVNTLSHIKFIPLDETAQKKAVEDWLAGDNVQAELREAGISVEEIKAVPAKVKYVRAIEDLQEEQQVTTAKLSAEAKILARPSKLRDLYEYTTNLASDFQNTDNTILKSNGVALAQACNSVIEEESTSLVKILKLRYLLSMYQVPPHAFLETIEKKAIAVKDTEIDNISTQSLLDFDTPMINPETRSNFKTDTEAQQDDERSKVIPLETPEFNVLEKLANDMLGYLGYNTVDFKTLAGKIAVCRYEVLLNREGIVAMSAELPSTALKDEDVEGEESTHSGYKSIPQDLKNTFFNTLRMKVYGPKSNQYISWCGSLAEGNIRKGIIAYWQPMINLRTAEMLTNDTTNKFLSPEAKAAAKVRAMQLLVAASKVCTDPKLTSEIQDMLVRLK